MNACLMILEELNKCRQNPSDYSATLVPRLVNYSGNMYNKPDGQEIETEEGRKGLEEAIDYLSSASSLSSIEWSEPLYKAAKAHLDDIGPLGLMGHFGSDLTDPSNRASKFCKWAGHLGENIDYGNTEAGDIIANFLIDDGDASRGQRLNLLRPEYKFAGIAVGPHSLNGNFCVVLFAENIIEDLHMQLPKKKAQKSEYVKVKQITKEEEMAHHHYKKKQDIAYGNFTKGDFEELKEVFDKLGGNSKGSINMCEIHEFLQKGNLSESSVFNRLQNVDLDSLGSVDFEKFVEALSFNQTADPSISIIKNEGNPIISPIVRKTQKYSDEMISDIKDFFDFVDNEKSGFIDFETLKNFADKREMESFSSTLVEAMQNMESSQNNKLDFGGFLEIISESESSSQIVSQFSEHFKTVLFENKKGRKVKKSSYETHSFSKQQKDEYENIS